MSTKFTSNDPCRICNGTGYTPDDPCAGDDGSCPWCGGAGRTGDSFSKAGSSIDPADYNLSGSELRAKYKMEADVSSVIPTVACPFCGKVVDRATGLVAETKPAVGDISICMYCFEVCLYGDDLEIRKLTDEESVTYRASPSWSKVEEGLAILKRLRRGVS